MERRANKYETLTTQTQGKRRKYSTEGLQDANGTCVKRGGNEGYGGAVQCGAWGQKGAISKKSGHVVE